MKWKLAIFLILLILCWFYFTPQPDNKIHIIACNVGQGDGLLIKSPQNVFSLIDGGPDGSILDCIGHHMPWYNRSVQTIILSHLHADHIVGAIEVFKRYKVQTVITNRIKQDTPEVQELFKEIKQKKPRIVETFKGEKIKYGDHISGTIFWPTTDAWNRESGEWQAYLYDFNDSSIVFSLIYKKCMFLFTGDAGTRILDQVARDPVFQKESSDAKVRILKVPHHGSSDAISQQLIDIFKPHLAMISVGKDNLFNHPSKATLDFLARNNITTIRTDQNSDLEIISDGEKVWEKYKRKAP